MTRRRSFQDEQISRFIPIVCILTVVFLGGAALGSVIASRFASDGSLSGFFMPHAGSTAREAFTAYFWPLMVAVAVLFLSSFFRAGLILAPVVVFLQGVRAAAGITAFVVGYGAKGYLAALSAELAPGFLALTALFLLSMQTMARASAHRPAMLRKIAADRAFLFSFLAGSIAVLLAALCYAALLPTLTQSVLSAIG